MCDAESEVMDAKPLTEKCEENYEDKLEIDKLKEKYGEFIGVVSYAEKENKSAKKKKGKKKRKISDPVVKNIAELMSNGLKIISPEKPYKGSIPVYDTMHDLDEYRDSNKTKSEIVNGGKDEENNQDSTVVNNLDPIKVKNESSVEEENQDTVVGKNQDTFEKNSRDSIEEMSVNTVLELIEEKSENTVVESIEENNQIAGNSQDTAKENNQGAVKKNNQDVVKQKNQDKAKGENQDTCDDRIINHEKNESFALCEDSQDSIRILADSEENQDGFEKKKQPKKKKNSRLSTNKSPKGKKFKDCSQQSKLNGFFQIKSPPDKQKEPEKVFGKDACARLKLSTGLFKSPRASKNKQDDNKKCEDPVTETAENEREQENKGKECEDTAKNEKSEQIAEEKELGGKHKSRLLKKSKEIAEEEEFGGKQESKILKKSKEIAEEKEFGRKQDSRQINKSKEIAEDEINKSKQNVKDETFEVIDIATESYILKESVVITEKEKDALISASELKSPSVKKRGRPKKHSEKKSKFSALTTNKDENSVTQKSKEILSPLRKGKLPLTPKSDSKRKLSQEEVTPKSKLPQDEILSPINREKLPQDEKLTPTRRDNLRETQTTPQRNAFQFMMDQRSKVIGSNSPGKAPPDTPPEDTHETKLKKERLSKRKSKLSTWNEIKGGVKRKVEEAEREEYAEKVLESRAKLMKEMLAGDGDVSNNNQEKSIKESGSEEKAVASGDGSYKENVSNEKSVSKNLFAKSKGSKNKSDKNKNKGHKNKSDENEITSVEKSGSKNKSVEKEKSKNNSNKNENKKVRSKNKQKSIETKASRKTSVEHSESDDNQVQNGRRKRKRRIMQIESDPESSNDSIIAQRSSKRKKMVEDESSNDSTFGLSVSKRRKMFVDETSNDSTSLSVNKQQQMNQDEISNDSSVSEHNIINEDESNNYSSVSKLQQIYEDDENSNNSANKHKNINEDESSNDSILVQSTSRRKKMIDDESSNDSTLAQSINKQKKMLKNGLLDFVSIAPKNVKKDTPKRTRKKKTVKNDEDTISSALTFSSLKNKLLVKLSNPAFKNAVDEASEIPLIKEEENEEEVTDENEVIEVPLIKNSKGENESEDIRRSSRKKAVCSYTEEDPDLGKTKGKEKKVAPVFLKSAPKPKEDPAVVQARMDFLRSGVPNMLKKIVEKQQSVEEIDDFNAFPLISHIQQKTSTNSSFWNLPPVHLDMKEYKYKVELNNVLKKGEVTLSDNKLPPKIDLTQITKNLRYNSIIEEIKSNNSSYPVYKTFRLLSEKAGRCFEKPDPVPQTPTPVKRKRGRPKKKPSAEEDVIIVENDVKVDANPADYAMWTEKYKPRSSQEIIGNYKSVTELRDWLNGWIEYSKEVRAGKKRKRSESSDFESTDGESRDSVKLPCNTMVLQGPLGCGKSTAVYAVCQELGVNVLEINASSKRTGKKLLQEMQEATQSHQVGKKEINPLTAFLHKDKIPKEIQEAKSKSENKMCILLIEDADIVFEQDEGFIYALNQLILTSKRPIIMLTSNVDCGHMQKFTSVYPVLSFSELSAGELSVWLQLVCLLEGVYLDGHSTGELLEWNKGDVRRTLLELQFWVQSGGDNECNTSRLFKKYSEDIVFDGFIYEDDQNSILNNFNEDGMELPAIQNGCIRSFVMGSVIPFPVNLGLVWWNLPDLLDLHHKKLNKREEMNGLNKDEDINEFNNYEGENELNKHEKVDEFYKREEIDKLKKVSDIYDVLAFSDVLYRSEGFDVESEPYCKKWDGSLKEGLNLKEEVIEFKTERNLSQQIAHFLVETSCKVLKPNFEGAINMAVPVSSERRRRINQHECEKEFLNAVPASYSAQSSSFAVDYFPALRTISRTEFERAKGNKKRGNRFYNYLKTLNVDINNSTLKTACNTFAGRR